jgi:hypothetical protein
MPMLEGQVDAVIGVDLDRALGAGLLGHAKAKLLAPMPRIGEVNLAQIVAEVGPVLERVDTIEQAIAECGAAPVTRPPARPGRWGSAGPPTGEHEPRCTPSPTPPAMAHLGCQAGCRARRRGKHHPHAIWILARAWLGVRWACWHTDTPPTPRPATAPNNASPPEPDSGNSNATSSVNCFRC